MDEIELPQQNERVDRSRYPKPDYSVDDERIRIINTTVSGLVLDLGTRKYSDVIKWGAYVSDSVFHLHDSSKCHFYCATLERCRLVAITPQTDPNWGNLHCIDCIFEGVFRYCLFGRASTVKCHHTPLTRIQHCDFSHARLDNCIFLDIDVNSVVWPKQPHIIIHEPWRHAASILGISSKQSLLGFLQDLALANSDLTVRALSLDWLITNKLGERDLDEFVNSCRKLDFIRVNF
ncbi:unnamed protein product [Tuwongella immobilis]|uniref:Uncharacterized protein n=1 Tax=Tuwongella immobilis TaxID=692036 RepID=A0A6C2YJS4_9BACT|nr:unnamed protein product [Tuwongella immobilis]VTR99573.1 unnamed protein product [Tuwongella immobilis]